MDKITLEFMTRELCHRFYKKFQNDPAIFMDMSLFEDYQYESEKVDRYFERQQMNNRIVFAIMRNDEPVGEIKLKYIDDEKKECSFRDGKSKCRCSSEKQAKPACFRKSGIFVRERG